MLLANLNNVLYKFTNMLLRFVKKLYFVFIYF